MLRFSFRCLRPHLRTSFHHQPEAQHPKYSAIHKNAGRLPHLLMLWTAPAPRDRSAVDWLSQPERFKKLRQATTVAFEVEGIGEDRRGNADKVDPGIGTTRMGQRIFECVLSIGTRSAQSIMASGFTAAQTGRTHDRTRPMLQQLRKFLPRRRRMFSAGTNSDIQPSRKTTFIEVPDGPYGASPLS